MKGIRKHTIAGVLPDDWDAALIKNRCAVVRGSSPRPAGDPRFFNGDFLPWITVADVTGRPGLYLSSTRSLLTEAGAKHTRTIPPGTLIISNSGATLGVPKITTITAGANDGIAMFLEPKGVSKEFMYFFLESKTDYFRNELAPGVGQPNLNTELLGDVAIPIPPIHEQIALANVLMEWGSAIEKTEQLIAAKQLLILAVLRRLITNRKKSWRQVSIRDVAERIQRQANGVSYPLLTISSASGFVRQDDRYSRYMAGESAKTYTLLRAGEFSYNKGNSLRYEFGCIFQLEQYEAALVPSVYVSFRLNDSVCTAYMRHLFAADYLKPQLRALVKTGVRNNGLLNIRPDEFMATTVPLPPRDEQQRIASALDAAQLEITLLKEQLAALREQKRGLMQKLLTGQWRIKPSSSQE